MIRDTVKPTPPIAPETSGGAVYERFKAEPDTLLIAVVGPDGAPAGLVERNSFFIRMASQYGRALYASRPIALLMNADPVRVEADQDLAEFTHSMLGEHAGELLRGFVVTENGRYLGVGTALDLLRAANAQNRRSAAEMRSLADGLALAKGAAERERLFVTSIVENIPSMLFVKDVVENRYVFVNRAVEATLGWARDEVVGRRTGDLLRPEEAALVTAQDEAVLASNAVVEVEEERLHGRDGAEHVVRTRKLAVADEAGAPRYIVSVSEDITATRAAQAQIERLAHYDALTDLSNRALFHQQLEGALAQARRTGRQAAVFCVDLDRFKSVNDTLGHAAGDALLRDAAERLRACVRAHDPVARLGGDEFALVQSGVRGPEEAQAVAARIVEALGRPFHVAGREVSVGASVGVAVFPRHADSGSELLKKADLALYRAKAEGRGDHRLFQAEMDDGVRARRALELDLREAFAQGEFQLHYQPLYVLRGERVGGYEALLRWPRADGSWTSPVDFIPAAEGTGLIAQLGEWVLRTACAEAATWPDARKVAVNVSPVQFRSAGLVSQVASALASSGLPAERLELEITESVLLSDDEANLRTLRQLKALGCRIALDDFGTGYSSLSYLRAFPFDKVKIDRSFVRDIPGEQALAIVTAVTSLAESLGMATTAEGVETAEQLEALRRVGCTEAQGYLIGRPTPAADLPHAVRSRAAA